MIQINPEFAMRATLVLVPILALAACATPREACISSVTREGRVLDQLVVETRANLARGFALETRQSTRTVRDVCTGRNEDGSKFLFRCEKTETAEEQVPVAIDLNAERAKLASLEQRQAQNRANAQAGIAQCVAANPE